MLKHTQTHILLTQLTVENREHTSKTSLCTFYYYHCNTKDLSIEQFIHTEATAVVWNGDILTYSISLYIPLVLKLKYLELINQESCCGIQTYKIQVLFQSKYKKHEATESCAEARPNRVLHAHAQASRPASDRLVSAPGLWQLTPLPISCQTLRRSEPAVRQCLLSDNAINHFRVRDLTRHPSKCQTTPLPKWSSYLLCNMSKQSACG